MQKIVINGQNELSGTIHISGAKNAVVSLIPAAILSDGIVTIDNVPDISDTRNLMEILAVLHCNATYENETIIMDNREIQNVSISEELSKKLRASYYFMGALLAKYKHVEIYFPGGCQIGQRPIDLHLKGFEQLGATITIEEDKYTISAEKLVGTKIYLDMASVGATVNLMLAAVKAEGTTIISNAAKEPEIVNVASLLNTMGAKIFGAGTSEITIYGVDKLGDARVECIPDRIETGTYIMIGTLLGNNLRITGIIEEHVSALLSKLKDMGVKYKIEDNAIIINKTEKLNAVDLRTQVFPGFATDLGQPMSVVLTQATGTSKFVETIYENRMGHIKYLQNMGASIELNGNKAKITGPTELKGTYVEATDLRAGAAMIIAALIAKGTTEITHIEHILRGYEKIIEKLQNVGADIKIVEES